MMDSPQQKAKLNGDASQALEENEILGEGDLATVLEELLPAQNQSRYIGLALKVPGYIVEGIHQRYANPKDCLHYVLLEILKQTDPIPTWWVIANALKSQLVGLPKLARDIQKKYCSSFSSLCGGASDTPTPCQISPPSEQLSSVKVQTPTFEQGDQISLRSRSLGIGLYGEVLEVDYNGETYAAKEYRSGFISPEELKTIFAKNLIGLRDTNVVPYYGVCNIMGTGRYVVVMERLETNLASFTEEKREIEPESKLSILHDVANGLEYLHSQNPIIVHCDLKPRNVLLTAKPTAKIADCGNCHVKPISIIEGRQEDTLYLDYLSPEASYGDEYSDKQDVFAFGHLSLYLIIQREPHKLAKPTYREHGELKARSELERRQAYIDEATQVISNSANILHPLLVFIRQCLNDDAANRPPITEFKCI